MVSGITLCASILCTVTMLANIPMPTESASLKKSYRPIYVPYIFQLFGDKGWKKPTKSKPAISDSADSVIYTSTVLDSHKYSSWHKKHDRKQGRNEKKEHKKSRTGTY